jgi:hypothetical protein
MELWMASPHRACKATVHRQLKRMCQISLVMKLARLYKILRVRKRRNAVVILKSLISSRRSTLSSARRRKITRKS